MPVFLDRVAMVPKTKTSGRGSKSKRLQWSDESMKAAIEAVSSGKMNISAASKMHKVPRKTLDDRVKGHVKHGHRPGVGTVLMAEEENSLEQYLVYMAKHGFPLTRTMVKALGNCQVCWKR